MIGSMLTGALSLALGYVYPAYECFKDVELNKPEIERLRFWCQYWILVAALTVFERVGESFISWVPMYSEAKVAFFVYLWYPRTRGTAYVYETFFRPYVAKHEPEIDRNLVELKTRAGDMAFLYSQRIVNYGQTRVFEILQYVASQSPSQSSRPRPAQQPQQARQTVPATSTRLPPVSQPFQPPARQPPPPPPANPVTTDPREPAKAAAPSLVPPLPVQTQSSGAVSPSSSVPSSSGAVSSSSTAPTEAEAMQVEVANATSNKDLETPMEEALRLTRARLRKRTGSAEA